MRLRTLASAPKRRLASNQQCCGVCPIRDVLCVSLANQSARRRRRFVFGQILMNVALVSCGGKGAARRRGVRRATLALGQKNSLTRNLRALTRLARKERLPKTRSHRNAPCPAPHVGARALGRSLDPHRHAPSSPNSRGRTAVEASARPLLHCSAFFRQKRSCEGRAKAAPAAHCSSRLANAALPPHRAPSPPPPPKHSLIINR